MAGMILKGNISKVRQLVSNLIYLANLQIITAIERKLAVIIWNMITKVQTYKKGEVQINNQTQKAAQLKRILKKDLGRSVKSGRACKGYLQERHYKLRLRCTE
jgi:hypothetical protein